MSAERGLTELERERIRGHADRIVAFASLVRLTRRYRAELELQRKADRVAARVLGGLIAIAALFFVLGLLVLRVFA